MPPGNHLLISWTVANVVNLSRRDRAIVTIAGVIPDLDGLGIPFDWMTSHRYLLYERYHHILAHNLAFCTVCTLLAIMLCRRRVLGAFLSAFSFHLHILCDLISGRGPDGYQWPIFYLYPFSRKLQLSWEGQWYLHSWNNTLVFLVFLIITVFIARKQKHTPIEIMSKRFDEKVLSSFRAVFASGSEEKGADPYS